MDLIKNVKDLIIGERSNTDQVSIREWNSRKFSKTGLSDTGYVTTISFTVL